MSVRPQFDDMFISEAHGYAMGIERHSGRHYVSIETDTGERHFEITEQEFARFLDDDAAGSAFADGCRAGEQDSRLFDVG